MATKPGRAFKYGDQPIRVSTVQVVEQLGGAATIKEVDTYLRELFPNYQDNTRSNLVINTVNCNRSHWPCNKITRRTVERTGIRCLSTLSHRNSRVSCGNRS